MKKIMIAMAFIAGAMFANAASVNWKAANVYSSDLTTKLAVGSEATLYAALVTESGVGDFSKIDSFTLTTAGTISGTFSEGISAGEVYNFYFIVEDGGKEFTSQTIENITIKTVGATAVNFANMTSATQNASNWAAVPEPTSGLLMLLGMAGLALRRRHV